jgi:transposase, IS6 family
MPSTPSDGISNAVHRQGRSRRMCCKFGGGGW